MGMIVVVPHTCSLINVTTFHILADPKRRPQSMVYVFMWSVSRDFHTFLVAELCLFLQSHYACIPLLSL